MWFIYLVNAAMWLASFILIGLLIYIMYFQGPKLNVGDSYGIAYCAIGMTIGAFLLTTSILEKIKKNGS
jgi:predicted anti-sigma-YlaC factor YlaD